MTLLTSYISGPTISTIPSSSTATAALPANLHMVPGQYVVGGAGYDCSLVGTYRFFDPNIGICQQRVCWDNNIDKYIASFCAIHHNGARDAGMTDSQAVSKALEQEIETLCGDIAQLTVDMLLQYGTFSARIVSVLTGTPNNYDNGHIVLEEKSSGSWRLWDMTNGVYFTDASGNHLHLKGIADLGIANCTMVQFCNKRVSCSPQSVPGGTLDNGFYEDFVTIPNGVRAWINRIYQIFSVKSGGSYYTYIPSALSGQTSWVEAQGYTNLMTETAWAAAYYS